MSEPSSRNLGDRLSARCGEAILACDSLALVNTPGTVRQPEDQNLRRESPGPTKSRHTSVLLIVIVAFVLRLLVITVGHTYRITPRRDHFQFGWETGRIARSIAL